MKTPSDRTDMQRPYDETDEVERLVLYLNEQLDPEGSAAVAGRLENDLAYREWAAPLLLAWKVPRSWVGNPVPREAIEKHWDAFTKEVGFVHQKQKKRRRRWIIFGSVVFALMAGWIAFGDRVMESLGRKAMTAMLTVVPDSGKWMTLLDGTKVRLDSGGILRASPRLTGGVLPARLEGDAHFRRDRSADDGMMRTGMMLMLGHAMLAVESAEFTVQMRRDTTYVAVIDRRRQPSDSMAEQVTLLDIKNAKLRLGPGDRARMIGSERLERLPRP